MPSRHSHLRSPFLLVIVCASTLQVQVVRHKIRISSPEAATKLTVQFGGPARHHVKNRPVTVGLKTLVIPQFKHEKPLTKKLVAIQLKIVSKTIARFNSRNAGYVAAASQRRKTLPVAKAQHARGWATTAAGDQANG